MTGSASEAKTSHTLRLAEAVRDAMDRSGRTLATLESCTGGLIASALTDVPGAGYLLGGGVAYDTHVKQAFGVPAQTIQTHGVVSRAVAMALAEAAQKWFGADIGLGITGVAGPGPEAGIAPGTAFVAITGGESAEVAELAVGKSDRFEAKSEMVDIALAMLVERLEADFSPIERDRVESCSAMQSRSSIRARN